MKENKYKNISMIDDYMSLLYSGMFFEFHPELSGVWSADKDLILGYSSDGRTHES